MLSIDEAIAHAREVASRKFDDRVHCIKCAEEHEQLAEWLEELKSYRASVFSGDMTQKMLKEEYCKAIDDFANMLSSKIKHEIDDCADELEWIDEIAKQLKAGDVD